MADPRVERLEPLRPRGLRVRVHVRPGDALDVALEAIERVGVAVGDRLTSEVRRRLLEADRDVEVREAALSLLSYRARTRTELRKRLMRKGFGAARVDPCLDRLQERGLLDDAAVASAFVRDRIRHRPRGPRRLTQELRAKGVAEPVARAAVEQVLDDEGLTEEALARDVVRAWLRRQGPGVIAALRDPGRSPEKERARRRLHGMLARRGFGGPALSQAMDEVVRLAEDP